MAQGKINLDEIYKRLTAIENSIRPGKIWGAWKWAIAHKKTCSTVLAAVFAAAAFFVGPIYVHRIEHPNEEINALVDGRIGAYINKDGGVAKALDDLREKTTRIDATLTAIQPYISQILNHDLGKDAKLSPSQLQGRLSELHNSLAAANYRMVAIEPGTTDALTRAMLKLPQSSPGYWPATAELVSLTSARHSARDFIDGTPSELPNCTDKDPRGFKVVEVGPVGDIRKLENPQYDNCRFTIDSPLDDARFNKIVTSGYPTIVFKDCLIVYRGGDFVLVTQSKIQDAPLGNTTAGGHGARVNYEGPTLQFQNCRFDFTAQPQVPENGKLLMAALLRQSGPVAQYPQTKVGGE